MLNQAMKTNYNEYNFKKVLCNIKFILLVTYLFVLFLIFHPTIYKPIIIDYWPSWSDKYRNDIKNTPDFVNVVNIAFAVPDGKGSIIWNDEGDKKQVQQIIDNLQKKNKLVLISVGGSTALLWNLKSVNIPEFAQNIKKFVDSYQLNGVDIDYELNEDRDELTKLLLELRKIMPKDKYIISYTASALGAYGIANHEHREWDGYPTKGIDVQLLREVGGQVDWVNVMAYNAFNYKVYPTYDPRAALLAFKDVLNGDASKIVLGINIGKQDWPENVIIDSKTILPWVEFVENQKFKGFMFWTLQYDTQESTFEPNATFSNIFADLLEKY